jgi:4-oxalocrotonate tautomerase
MPIVNITLIEGRSDEDKERLMSKVTEAIVESIGAPIQTVRVIINEVPAKHFSVGGVSKAAKTPVST